MEEKPWYKSKTIWINVAMFAGSFLPLMTDHLSSGEALTGAAIVNMILRALTGSPIKRPGQG